MFFSTYVAQRRICQIVTLMAVLLCGEVTRSSESFFWLVDNGHLYRLDVEQDQLSLIGDTGLPTISDYGGVGYHRQTNRLLAVLGSGVAGTASSLVEIDRATGHATPIATIAAPGPNDFYSGFDISPTGDAYVVTSASAELFAVDLSSGALSPKFNLGADSAVGDTDLAFDNDGRLWDIGHVATSGALVLSQIDLGNGSVNIKHNLNVPIFSADTPLGFNTSDGRLYWITEDRPLMRVNPETGQVEVAGATMIGLSESVGTFAPIPEPSGAGLCAAMLMGLLFHRCQQGVKRQ